MATNQHPEKLSGLKGLKIPAKLPVFLNFPRLICDHLVGEHHSCLHRMFAGVFIMAAGVLVSKSGEGVIMHFIADMVGYAIHGIGAIPFIEKITAMLKD